MESGEKGSRLRLNSLCYFVNEVFSTLRSVRKTSRSKKEEMYIKTRFTENI